MTTADVFESLYDCLRRRPRPEDVAQIVEDALGPALRPDEARVLSLASRHSLRKGVAAWSSMADSFFRAPGADRQVQAVSSLFGIAVPDALDCTDPDRVLDFLAAVAPLVAWQVGAHGQPRLDRAGREAAGVAYRKRAYNKRFRLLKRLEQKLVRMARNERIYGYTRLGKGGFVLDIALDDLRRDLPTACFVAYYVARLGLRSAFANGPQERAFDEVSATLFGVARRSPSCDWFTIAQVRPDAEVLARLSDGQRGILLGRAFGVLEEMADLLAEQWSRLPVDRATLVVRRGSDSSTWNQIAGGWNRAREHWISLLYAMNLDHVLESICPGKVLRLMAADVARWHQASGGGLHPDTKVWAALPLPWEVLAGRATCGRERVLSACREAGVLTGGWVMPRGERKPVPFKPTPELVHGVAVASPALAATLRQARWFSGKDPRPLDAPIEVTRDAKGFALGARGVS
jgi:hypothetical protein